MSFGRAKRFQERQTSQPAVGQYDPHSPKDKARTVVFEKAKRFSESKDETPGPGYNPADSTFLHPGLCTSFRVLSHSTPNLTGSGKKTRQKQPDQKSDKSESKKPIMNLMAAIGQDGVGTECEALEDRLRTISENLESSEACRQTLQIYKDKVEEANKSLSRSLKDLRLSAFDNEDMIRHLKGELFAYKDSAESDRQAVFESSAERALLLEKIQELEEMEATLNDNIRALTDKYIALEQQHNELCSTHDTKITTLETELDLTKDNLADLKKYQVTLEQINQKLRDDITEYDKNKKSEDELAKAMQRSDYLEREIQEKVSFIEELIVERDELLKVDCDLREVVEELRLERDKLERCLHEKETAVGELVLAKEVSERLVEEKCKVIDDIGVEMDVCKQSLADKEKMLVELSGEKGKLLRHLEEEQVKIEEVLVEKEELEKEVKERCADVERLGDEVKRLKICVDEKSELCEGLTLESERYKKSADDGACTIERLNVEKRELEEVVREKNEVLCSVNVEKDLLVKRIEEKEGTIGNLERMVREFEEKVLVLEFLQNEKQRLIDLIEEKDRSICDLANEIRLLREKEKRWIELEAEYKSQVEDLSAELVEQECRIQRLEGDLREQVSFVNERDARLLLAEQGLAGKERVIQKMDSERRQLKEDFTLRETELMAAITEQKVNLQHATSESEAYQKRVSELEQDIVQIQKGHNELNVCNEKLRNALNSKDKELETCQGQCEELTSSYQTLACNHASLQLDFDRSRVDNTEADYKIEQERLRLDNESLASRLHTTQTQLDAAVAENGELTEQIAAKTKYANQLTSKLAEMKTSVTDNSDEARSLRLKLLDTVILNKSTQMTLSFTQEKLTAALADASGWKAKYNELEERIEPFREQLSMFEAEKNSLLNRNKDAAAEIAKLGRDYANILGHQNNKQKIKHIVNLKEENYSLKQDVAHLREELDKKRRQVRRMEERVAASEGRQRFDPARAFSTSKENIGHNSTLSNKSLSTSRLQPLRDGNRL